MPFLWSARTLILHTYVPCAGASKSSLFSPNVRRTEMVISASLLIVKHTSTLPCSSATVALRPVTTITVIKHTMNNSCDHYYSLSLTHTHIFSFSLPLRLFPSLLSSIPRFLSFTLSPSFLPWSLLSSLPLCLPACLDPKNDG